MLDTLFIENMVQLSGRGRRWGKKPDLIQIVFVSYHFNAQLL